MQKPNSIFSTRKPTQKIMRHFFCPAGLLLVLLFTVSLISSACDSTDHASPAHTPPPTPIAPPAVRETPSPTNTPTPTPTPIAPPAPSLTPSVTSTPTATSTAKHTTVAIYVQSNGQTHDLNITKVNGEFIKSLHKYAAAPTWSPEGTRIAFYGEPGIVNLGGIYSQGTGVWITDAWQDKEPIQLVHKDHIENMDWSPDGTKLAFEIDPPGIAQEVVIVDAKSGQEISRFSGEEPTWRPDSQKLIIRACLPSCGLWLVNSNGTDEHQITSDDTDSYPSWSPNGQQLVFASHRRDNNWEIYRLRLADGNLLRLTNRPATDTTPVFGPDGREIYLRTDAFGGWRITAINIDGHNERTIVEGIGPSDKWGLARPAIR